MRRSAEREPGDRPEDDDHRDDGGDHSGPRSGRSGRLLPALRLALVDEGAEHLSAARRVVIALGALGVAIYRRLITHGYVPTQSGEMLVGYCDMKPVEL